MKNILLLIIYAINLLPVMMQAQNPICPEGTFFADPSARQFGDSTVYLYGSCDENADYWCSYRNDVLSSTDMHTWAVHSNVFASKGKNDEVQGTDALLFASDCIQKESLYYLFFCTPDKSFSEGIAVAHSPVGPFRNGRKIRGCVGIDPTVLVDEDGSIYYYWGQNSLCGAKLNADLCSVDSVRKDILTERQHFFHEGAQAFRRGDMYYLTYTSKVRKEKATCIAYSTASSPWGPFTYRGVIIDNAGCDPQNWNNHGSVANINGRWYVFYHRSTNGTKVFRKACVEPIQFDENGLIKEVEMTSNGASGFLNPFKETEARLVCKLSGNVRIITDAGGQERLSGIKDGDTAIFRYFAFDKCPGQVTLGVKPGQGGQVTVMIDGKPVGKITVPKGELIAQGKLSGKIAKGIHSVKFRFDGPDCMFELDNFKFE